MALRFKSTAGIFCSLILVWAVAFIHYELVAPALSALSCTWAQYPHNQTNILLVADPQLIDNHTYPGRSDWLLDVSKHTVDVYLKQNYQAMVRHLQPDYVFFLGDLLDNGRSSSDEYFAREARRFHRIFDNPRYVQGQNVFYNVPGNHDIGFGAMVKPHSRTRFAETFGHLNSVVHIAGVDFVMLDTPSLSSPDRPINGNAKTLVANIPPVTNPRVLLSHVPLYRDTAEHPCGPLRESSEFRQSAGYQYQSALTPELSAEILAKVQPTVLFSGDDHDYCDVQHTENSREITVKSISMAMGIKYPAVQLLSFTAAEEGHPLNYDTRMCYLPQPYVDVFVYVALAVVSGVVLLAWSVGQRAARYSYSTIPMWEPDTADTVFVSNGRKVVAMNDAAAVLAPAPMAAPSTADTLGHVADVVAAHAAVYARAAAKHTMFFMRKWNLGMFLKHCALLAMAVLAFYNITLQFI